MQDQSIKTQAKRLRALAPQYLGRELSSIQSLQLISRVHGHRDWQTAKAAEAAAPAPVTSFFTVSYAADTSTDGLYMTEPEVFLTRDAAFDEAEDRLRQNVYVDAGVDPGDLDSADEDRAAALRSILEDALEDLESARAAGHGGHLLTVEYDEDLQDDNTSNFSLLISELRLPSGAAQPSAAPAAKLSMHDLAEQLHEVRVSQIADMVEGHTGTRPKELTLHWTRGEEYGLPVLDLVEADGVDLMDADHDTYAWELPEPAFQSALRLLEDAFDGREEGRETYAVPARPPAPKPRAGAGVLNPAGVPAALRAERRWAVLTPNHATEPLQWVPNTLRGGQLQRLNFTRTDEWLTFEDAAAHAVKHGLEIGFIMGSDSPVLVLETPGGTQVPPLGYMERTRDGAGVRVWFREGSSASAHLRTQGPLGNLTATGQVIRVTGVPMSSSEADLPWVDPAWFTAYFRQYVTGQ